jgi:hypothetical protein
MMLTNLTEMAAITIAWLSLDTSAQELLLFVRLSVVTDREGLQKNAMMGTMKILMDARRSVKSKRTIHV